MISLRIRIVSYSGNGRNTAASIAEVLRAEGHETATYALKKYCADGDKPLMQNAQEWAKEGFSQADALIFCCASGIAVRAIAPSVKDKSTDPAVIVLDERANYVIPLLSGHIGGANELALLIAGRIGAVPVLTTATDINGLFAVDVFASKNHLFIEDMQLAKEVSAALLRGEKVSFLSDFPVEGSLPGELTSQNAKLGIIITNDPYAAPFEKTLRLIPRRYCAGIGCRRGKAEKELEDFLLSNLSALGILEKELRSIASIDLKKDEAGILSLCSKYRLPFITYTADELMSVPGEFTKSEFVRATVGVDCVCERAACLAAGGNLVQKKTAANGITFALAKYEEAIRFE